MRHVRISAKNPTQYLLFIMHLLNNFFQLGEKFYTSVKPRGLSNPKKIALNNACAKSIGLHTNRSPYDPFWKVFSGNSIPDSAHPLAMVYAGHQFGGFSPQLGDGRGLLLGEISTPEGLKDVHLKGAGQTPYSRFGDGHAVLRSCIREYLASAAMRGLNIPSTDALCIFCGDDPVQREQIEPAAMLTRIAKSHIRFGHFEYFHYTQQFEQLKTLADYCVKHYLPDQDLKQTPYPALLQMATQTTAHTIGLWQAEGFAHGVMNTDNMSIIGETLDYGPFGFMERYDPKFICNHSDSEGRYAFDQQPSIGLWNLNALAFALSSLIDRDESREILMEYQPALLQSYHSRLAKKLGLSEILVNQHTLLQTLFKLLEDNAVDYSIFFRRLSEHQSIDWKNKLLALSDKNTWQQELPEWLELLQTQWREQKRSPEEIATSMLRNNPKFILRNYLAENAIKAAYQNDYSEIDNLTTVLSSPYENHQKFEHYAAHPPAWAQHLQVSCSS